MPSEKSYDLFAAEYKDSKQLPFRTHVEAFTLFKLLGEVEGLSILDLACGEGIYARRLMKAGAARVCGVDLSEEMIALAVKEERRDPLGCHYQVGDAGELGSLGRFDVVVGAYLLNYAASREELTRFARTIHSNLKPGGRFIGVNDNPAQDPAGYAKCEQYGFTKSSPGERVEGDAITYEFPVPGGGSFRFDNYYLHPSTFSDVFTEAGFTGFEWIGPWLDPRGMEVMEASYWDDFMSDPPIVGVQAIGA